MDVAALVISCLGLVVAVVAGWYSRRSVTEAKRSADAAAEVADVDRARRADEVADAERRRVRFELVPEGGSAYVLQNVGTATAYGVHVDTGGLGFQDEVTDFEEFEADGEHRYLLTRTMDPDQADHVVVTWHHRPDRSDERRSVTLLGP
jgi:hypothetical protein